MVVSPYLVNIISSLYFSATVDVTVMNCQLKVITIHAVAWDNPYDRCVSHFGSVKFLYVNWYVEYVI